MPEDTNLSEHSEVFFPSQARKKMKYHLGISSFSFTFLPFYIIGQILTYLSIVTP